MPEVYLKYPAHLIGIDHTSQMQVTFFSYSLTHVHIKKLTLLHFQEVLLLRAQRRVSWDVAPRGDGAGANRGQSASTMSNLR